jgi:phosphohistidine phosphatase
MKKLFLLRHGKASSSKVDEKDFDRPLNKKGIAQINQQGQHLQSEHPKFDQLIYSSAKRTKETAEIANEQLSIKALISSEDLYLADEHTILSFIKANAFDENILYVGHNFGISRLASDLAGYSISMTTGMMIEFDLDIGKWDELKINKASLKSTYAPKINLG